MDGNNCVKIKARVMTLDRMTLLTTCPHTHVNINICTGSRVIQGKIMPEMVPEIIKEH